MYHFAWQGVNALERNDFDIQLRNIDICMECLRLASKLHVKKFIFPGSTYEYMYCGHPINETALPTPQNAYGSVKAALRYIAAEYAKTLKVEFIYVVIAGIYAADRRDNNVIFYVIDQLLRGEKPKVTKLEQMWDYVHIDDVTEALYLVGEKGRNGGFYAIGKADNQPLYKYIEEIHNYIDPTLPIGIGEVPYSSDKLPMSCIDLTAIQRDTGFVPKVDFKDGIKEVIDIMKEEYERDNANE
jgi:nucleoside-diphosphate-sugar epimerase